MVAIVDKINGNRSSVHGGANVFKPDDNHQTARIIQWLGGERAGIF